MYRFAWCCRESACASLVAVWIGCGFNPATDGPPAGNPEGSCPIPTEAQAADAGKPDHVVGNGTPESCTSEAFLSAVAGGSVITFNCGPDPVTITVDRTAKIANSGPTVVIDGGNKIALSGGGKVRILSLDTCDSTQGWPASFCQNQDGPELTVQNLTFSDGNTNGEDLNGGGAIFASGGRLKVVNTRFFRNVCNDGDWMGGGGAIRAINQHNAMPVYVVSSTFGGQEGLDNKSVIGGAISGVDTLFIVLNSVLTHNQAVAEPHVGVGGAIYSLGATALSLCGVEMTDNTATGAGGAIWFGGENDQSMLSISNSTLRNNHDTAADTESSHSGIYAKGQVIMQSSTIE